MTKTTQNDAKNKHKEHVRVILELLFLLLVVMPSFHSKGVVWDDDDDEKND